MSNAKQLLTVYSKGPAAISPFKVTWPYQQPPIPTAWKKWQPTIIELYAQLGVASCKSHLHTGTQKPG